MDDETKCSRIDITSHHSSLYIVLLLLNTAAPVSKTLSSASCTSALCTLFTFQCRFYDKVQFFRIKYSTNMVPNILSAVFYTLLR